MAKQGNKGKKNNQKEEVVTSYSIKSILILVGCVLVVFLGFYLFTLHMTKKNSESSNEDITDEVSFSYDTILLGQSLSMSDEEYYVLYYDFDDENSSTYQDLFTNYQSSEEHSPIYQVDMSSGFNKQYITEGESNQHPASVSEFAIKGATLIKVRNHEVVDYLEGEESITNLLS